MIRSLWRPPRLKSQYRLHLDTPRESYGYAAVISAKSKSFSNVSTHHDDHNLRQIFDSSDFWDEFSQQSKPRLGSNCLLQNKFLAKPNGFLEYARTTQARSQKIVEEVSSASSTADYISIPRKLDLLSDLLCRILDVADFVRAVHPNSTYHIKAAQAYSHLFEYMNVLNTTPGLNEQLRKAQSTPEITNAWNEEEKIVAQILLKEFAQSAIHLPEQRRRRFVHLSNQVKQLGSEFAEEMAPRQSSLDFDISQLNGMDPRLFARLSTRRGKLSLPTTGEMQYMALGSVHKETVRQALYISGRECSKGHIEKLEQLMRTRAELARLSGYESFAHMNLSDKLAKSPVAVNSFLTALSTDNAPAVVKELANMKKLKIRDVEKSSTIEPWDVMYYRNIINASLPSRSRKSDFVSAYFSLGTVMQGLSRLFSHLYGISFVPQETTPGETWIEDVRRLNVIHETEGHIAILYCDLFARVGKTPNPTHFTLRCSRVISSSEIVKANGSPQDANDGMAVHFSKSNNQWYQMPIIALVCDFSPPSANNAPALLSFQDVRTLFHEMGHAIHSILGRTSLQIVSGTRCPTDFAELPSVLMEYFAADLSVLALFARHWETDAPLPCWMVEDELRVMKQGHALQKETQILFSLLDQAYHSSLPLITGSHFDSTKVFFDVYDTYGHVREPRNTNAQGLFGHLVEYGGTYYSYLFDRAIAGKLWKEVFRGGKDGGVVDREAGERLR